MAEEARLAILLLEDQALVRAGMRALIEASEPGAAIHEARSYDEALARLAATPIDIAFVDIDLKAQRSGIDVLRHIRNAELPTRVIMLSGRGDAATVFDCIRLGASGYIVKDMEAAGLFRRALDMIFMGGVFVPEGIFSGRADAPAQASSLDDIGVRGRAAEALYYICQGYSNAVIAHKMGVTERTVANEYNSKLFRNSASPAAPA